MRTEEHEVACVASKELRTSTKLRVEGMRHFNLQVSFSYSYICIFFAVLLQWLRASRVCHSRRATCNSPAARADHWRYRSATRLLSQRSAVGLEAVARARRFARAGQYLTIYILRQWNAHGKSARCAARRHWYCTLFFLSLCSAHKPTPMGKLQTVLNHVAPRRRHLVKTKTNFAAICRRGLAPAPARSRREAPAAWSAPKQPGARPTPITAEPIVPCRDVTAGAAGCGGGGREGGEEGHQERVHGSEDQAARGAPAPVLPGRGRRARVGVQEEIYRRRVQPHIRKIEETRGHSHAHNDRRSMAKNTMAKLTRCAGERGIIAALFQSCSLLPCLIARGVVAES